MFQSRAVPILLVLPALLFVGLGFLLPVGILLAEAFTARGGWGVDNFLTFFADPLHREVFFRTIRLACLVTLLSAVLGYAAAFAILARPVSQRGFWIGMVMLPLMVSPVARTYAWIVILGRTGFVNSLLLGMGLTSEPLRLLFTETAVFIGLVQLFLPFMVLSLLSSLENLPADVVSAARLLGAGWLTVFGLVILPLTREGLVIGGTLVFSGAITAYITPAVLGGSKVLMLETLLYQKVSVSNDFISAAVIAAILVLTSLAANRLLRVAATARRR